MAKRTKTAASSDAEADPIGSDDLPGDTDVIGPWVPSHRDVMDFVNLNKRVLAVTQERSFSAIWPEAIRRAAERTTVSLFIATAAAMNGSRGAWLEVIDFCRQFDLPLPPVISSVISKQYVALFDHRPVWQKDRRIGTPIARLRYECINSILELNRCFVEYGKTVKDLENASLNSEQCRKFGWVLPTERAEALEKMKQDYAETPDRFDDLCKGAFVPEELDDRAALGLLWSIGPHLPVDAKRVGMAAEKHALEDYRKMKQDYKRMVKPENVVDFCGQEVWPGRHYIPSNDTLERLGYGDWIVLLHAFEILPDTPSTIPSFHLSE